MLLDINKAEWPRNPQIIEIHIIIILLLFSCCKLSKILDPTLFLFSLRTTSLNTTFTSIKTTTYLHHAIPIPYHPYHLMISSASFRDNLTYLGFISYFVGSQKSLHLCMRKNILIMFWLEETICRLKNVLQKNLFLSVQSHIA